MDKFFKYTFFSSGKYSYIQLSQKGKVILSVSTKEFKSSNFSYEEVKENIPKLYKLIINLYNNNKISISTLYYIFSKTKVFKKVNFDLRKSLTNLFIERLKESGLLNSKELNIKHS